MPLNGLRVIIVWTASCSVFTAALTISPPRKPTSASSATGIRQALLPTISHEPYHVRNGSSSKPTTTAPVARSDPALPSYRLPFIVTVGLQVISIPLTVSSGRLVVDSGQTLGPTNIATINNDIRTSLVLTRPATIAPTPSLLPSFNALVIGGTTYPLATATTWSATTADAATDATTPVLATRTAGVTIATATAGSASTTVAAASLALANTTAAVTTAKANATARTTASGKSVLVAGQTISTSAEETLSFSEMLSFSFLSHPSSVTSSSARTSLSLPSVSFVVPSTNGDATAGSGRAGGSARPTLTVSGVGTVGVPLELGVGCIGVILLVVLRVVGL